MDTTVLEELNERFPFTRGLVGQALASSISNHWDEMDEIDIAGMFRRMAMFVAERE